MWCGAGSFKKRWYSLNIMPLAIFVTARSQKLFVKFKKKKMHVDRYIYLISF